MALDDYILGLAIVAGIWGGAAALAWIVVERRLPRLGGAPRVLAGGLVATAAIVAAELLPAVFGVLSRWTALGVALTLLAAAWRFVPRTPGAAHDDTPEPGRESGVASSAIAALALAAVAIGTTAKLWAATREASEDVDTLAFHLPSVGRWLETGSIWQVDQFTPLLPNGNYPHNGDLVFTSVVAAFESDAFVRAVNVPFLALAVLAVYAIARELGAPRATAATGGAVFAALPVISYATFDGAKTDPMMLACFGAGALFLLRHGRRGRRSDLVLAGLGIGLAFGTKWYGVPAAAVMVAAWGAATLLRGGGPRAVLAGGSLLTGLIAAAGGIWLVRNAVESGSPLFPVGVPGVWDVPRDVIRECAGFRIADYLGDGRIWSDYVYPAYRDNYALAGVVLVAGWAGAAALAIADRLRGRTSAATPGVLMLAGAIAVLGVIYTITPYTALGAEGEPVLIGANTRWLTPALLLCAGLLAWALGRLRRLRPVAELAALVAVATGVWRGADLPLRTMAAAALLLALAAATGYGVLVLRGRFSGGAQLPAAAAGGALIMLLAVGYARQREYHGDRFARQGDPVISYLGQRAKSGHRIGIAGVPDPNGSNPVWPAFGARLGNHVAFVGRFADGHLREYDNRAAWTRAIRDGRFDLLVVGRGGYAPGCRLPGSETDDDAWARAAGFERLAATERLTLYSVR